MGSDQSSQRRTQREDSFTYVRPATTSNYSHASPPARPSPPARLSLPARPQPQPLQQNVNQRTAASQNRIYPTLEQPTTNATLDFYQRHMQQPAQRYTPSAPPEVIVNNNNNVPTRTATNHRSRPQRKPENSTSNFNCQTCGQAYGIRIFQCLGGHSCCENCKSMLRPCRSCGQSIGNMRNFALEECMAELKVPCLNKDEGCSLTFKKIDMDDHMKECPFMERSCPLQTLHIMTCHWKGKLSNLSAHFDLVHPDNRKAEVGTEMIINNVSAFINISHHFIYLITIGAFNFFLHISIKKNDKLSMAVQFCGTTVSANKWTYEFHVYNKQEPRKKYLYTDICQSYNVPEDEIFKNAAVLPMVYVSGFVNSDNFTYKVFIKKNGPYNRDENVHPRGRGRGRGINKGNRSSSVSSNATN